MTKTERDEMRAFCVDARARFITWNESDQITDLAIKALDDLDAQDAEAARLTAENDRLIATARADADQWQGRYWDERNKVADRDATIMAERSGAAIMLRRCREERDELGSAIVMAKAEHAQELAAVERKWMEVANRNALEREAIAEEARALAYDAGRRLEAAEAEAQKAAREWLHVDAARTMLVEERDALRQRVEAAEAEAERLRGVDLANRALCEWQKEKQDDLADMRRRLDAAEAQTAKERLRADLESASATDNFKAVAALRKRVDAAERLRGAWEKDFMALHSRFEAAEANLTAEKENHLAALNIILRRVQRPGSPPPGGIELAILISIRQWQEENAALHQRLEAAIAEARRTRDEEIRALMQRLEAAEAETKRVVDLVRANDIAALIVDRADAIQRAEAAEKDAAAAREEIRALHQERKGEVWFWQSDEEDHLESLTCPVLIPAEALRKLLADRAVDREQDLTTIAELKRKLEKYGSHLWSCVFRIEDVPCNCGLIDAAESPDQAR